MALTLHSRSCRALRVCAPASCPLRLARAFCVCVLRVRFCVCAIPPGPPCVGIPTALGAFFFVCLLLLLLLPTLILLYPLFCPKKKARNQPPGGCHNESNGLHSGRIYTSDPSTTRHEARAPTDTLEQRLGIMLSLETIWRVPCLARASIVI